METEPLVSIILPVHGSTLYASKAIQSMLQQTYTHFELLVICSATTDIHTEDIQTLSADSRVRFLKQQPGENLPQALNQGIDEAGGVYIVRMDADDISFSDRLAVQVAYMQSRLDIAVSGTWAETFGEKNIIMKQPTDPFDVEASLLFRTSLIHPSVIMRKEVLEKYHFRYDPTLSSSEDLDLWVRVSEKAHLANLARVLLLYRTHPLQATQKDRSAQARGRSEIHRKQLERLGVDLSERELALHHALCVFESENSPEFLHEVNAWLQKISESNRISSVYAQKNLDRILGEIWFTACLVSSRKMGFEAWSIFVRNSSYMCFEKNIRNSLRVVKFAATSLVRGRQV